jgi:ketosteroid isomerase-like protein
MNNQEKPLSDEDKFQLANTFLTALKSKDWQTMHSILTDNASWTLPGTSLLSGEAKGAHAVVDRAGKLRSFGVMVELLHILYSMNGVALSLHNTAQRGDLKLDEYVVIVMELKDKKIAKLTTHLNDVAGINNFFIDGII